MTAAPGLQPLIDQLAQLGVRPGVPFRRPELLALALTHRSAHNPAGSPHNERLEMLGDAVLGYLVADLLFDLCPEADEGLLTRVRAALVDEEALAARARRLGLGDLLVLGRGEEQTGGRERSSILANAFEAMVAALVRSEGLDVAARLVSALFEEDARHRVEEGAPTYDPKTLLQQTTQAAKQGQPTYRLLATHGPDHDRRFVVEVLVGDAVVGRGHGRTKKQAEQQAAADALQPSGTGHSGLAGPGRGA